MEVKQDVHDQYNQSGLMVSNPARHFQELAESGADSVTFHVEVADGTTVAELFRQRIGGAKPHDYLIRVNRQPVSQDQVLKDGDRITISPTKIEGACRL